MSSYQALVYQTELGSDMLPHEKYPLSFWQACAKHALPGKVFGTYVPGFHVIQDVFEGCMDGAQEPFYCFAHLSFLNLLAKSTFFSYYNEICSYMSISDDLTTSKKTKYPAYEGYKDGKWEHVTDNYAVPSYSHFRLSVWAGYLFNIYVQFCHEQDQMSLICSFGQCSLD